ncbi:formate dehydrogenase accessory protein FdhE [Nitrospirillum amazonense]|uniref:formate dehydrogenase accessory protein FdhE n=1 Tax=Nitrospirillum amazonense TaxID=28077 RepID=UPI002DD42AC4|nr:formate dehydrogenase accessory protein FdhE [Nitrospirillum amazonense]MEC4589913.1 formate dehydrogenase accessory protein FdhE [Nitrospirillum amazonense]
MRQGEVAPKAPWIGNPQGGVTAPAPIILPDPSTRFARTSGRLGVLAVDHPMAQWLEFLCELSQAQHDAADMIDVTAPDADDVATAAGAGMPPLAADGHERDIVWREALTLILRHFDRLPEVPDLVASVIDSLNEVDGDTLEYLANDFLSGNVAPEDAGRAVFIAAALQVYFTKLAATLDESQVHLLPERGLCPCCGSTPVAGVITASGSTPGVRYLYCSLCSTAWNHVRAVCITCGQSAHLSLKSVEGENGAVQVETCDDCHTYAKMLYVAKDPKLDPYADDLASLGLDLMVAEVGWLRHAPNPLLLA